MSIAVAGVLFNHQYGQANSAALPLRYNDSNPVLLPEWRAGQAYPSVVAYVLDKLPSSVTIYVQFFSTRRHLGGVEVQARTALPGDSSSSGALALLDLSPRYIAFDRNGLSPWYGFTVSRNALPFAVGIATFNWQWEFRHAGPDNGLGTWSNFQTTTHKIYTVLAVPTEPWSTAHTERDWPRTDALDFACSWAQGATGAIEVATRITASVYRLGGLTLTYDNLIGAPHYTTLGIPRFLLDEFIDRLRGGFGAGPLLNCSDCAAIVSTFANLLGADLWQSKMGLIGFGFGLNPIRAIGSTRWSRLHGSFGFHEVAWSGDCLQDDLVYDACVNLDGDNNPQTPPHRAQVPAALVFGRTGDNQYRDKLASEGSRRACEPQPSLRIRRPIGSRLVALPSLPVTIKDDVAARYNIKFERQEKERYRFEHFTWFGGELSGWTLVSSRVIDGTALVDRKLSPAEEAPLRVSVTLWRTIKDAGKLLRIESIEASCNTTAKHLLMQSIAQIQHPALENWPRGVVDESAVGLPTGELALFTRCNHLHIVRSAGSKGFNVRKIANAIDQWLTEAGLPDKKSTASVGFSGIAQPWSWKRWHLAQNEPKNEGSRLPASQRAASITPRHARLWQSS